MFSYVLLTVIEPITSSAHLQLHTKPEQDDFSIPKIILNVVMEQIGVCLAKNQVIIVVMEQIGVCLAKNQVIIM